MSSNERTAEAPCGQSCPCGGVGGGSRSMPRRDFVTAAAAALAAMALDACAGGSLTSPGTIASTQIKVSNFPTLANVGGVATTNVSAVPLALVRTGSTSFAAFSRICPHQGTTVDVVSGGFHCPRHGATFNLSGQWTGGQRTSNLTSYPVAYDETTGTLTIGG